MWFNVSISPAVLFSLTTGLALIKVKILLAKLANVLQLYLANTSHL